MTDLKQIPVEKLTGNVFKLIDKDWMLITAGVLRRPSCRGGKNPSSRAGGAASGTVKSWNTMTASWGGLGVLWNRPVAFAFVRPTRHTYGFMERAPRFTLSFFAEKYRPALLFCGTKSGRDVDKAKQTGLVPVSGAPGTVHFAQARLVLECRKVYTQDVVPSRFLDPKIEKLYPKKDYHRMYVGQITRCLAAR